ncbi:hypothetical protein AALO_G00084690 [Alosa alosa]|uniref:Uncharacterized protein n=1 Tax=Alosa alosa TaxID=278164 RepID=A0AAV6GZ60_9TELE|nr:hypothetical protein AALO_G00084690 [Alosa alosa]
MTASHPPHTTLALPHTAVLDLRPPGQGQRDPEDPSVGRHKRTCPLHIELHRQSKNQVETRWQKHSTTGSWVDPDVSEARLIPERSIASS